MSDSDEISSDESDKNSNDDAGEEFDENAMSESGDESNANEPNALFTLDMTSSYWREQEQNWKKYMQENSDKTEDWKIEQIQSVCTGELRIRMEDTTQPGEFIETEASYLQRIKELSVCLPDQILRSLFELVQEPGESVKDFAGRLGATAELCELSVACRRQDCSQETSVRDSLVLQALVGGLADPGMRRLLHIRQLNKKSQTVSDLVEYISTEETRAGQLAGSLPLDIVALICSYLIKYGDGDPTKFLYIEPYLDWKQLKRLRLVCKRFKEGVDLTRAWRNRCLYISWSSYKDFFKYLDEGEISTVKNIALKKDGYDYFDPRIIPKNLPKSSHKLFSLPSLQHIRFGGAFNFYSIPTNALDSLPVSLKTLIFDKTYVSMKHFSSLCSGLQSETCTLTKLEFNETDSDDKYGEENRGIDSVKLTQLMLQKTSLKKVKYSNDGLKTKFEKLENELQIKIVWEQEPFCETSGGAQMVNEDAKSILLEIANGKCDLKVNLEVKVRPGRCSCYKCKRPRPAMSWPLMKWMKKNVQSSRNIGNFDILSLRPEMRRRGCQDLPAEKAQKAEIIAKKREMIKEFLKSEPSSN